MLTKFFLTLIKYTEPPFDCECCGSCYPQGTIIQLDGTDIWHAYSDGHMGGFYPEISIEDAVFNAVAESCAKEAQKLGSEKERLSFLEQYPQSVTASSEKAWKEHCFQSGLMTLYAIENARNCVKSSEHPTKEINILKMLALWLDEYLGIEVQVEDLS